MGMAFVTFTIRGHGGDADVRLRGGDVDVRLRGGDGDRPRGGDRDDRLPGGISGITTCDGDGVVRPSDGGPNTTTRGGYGDPPGGGMTVSGVAPVHTGDGSDGVRDRGIHSCDGDRDIGDGDPDLRLRQLMLEDAREGALFDSLLVFPELNFQLNIFQRNK